MHAHRWKPEHRDALLARVTVLTAGTAVVGTVGAIALGAGLASATPVAAKKTAPAAAKQSAPQNTPAAATPSGPNGSTSGGSSTSASLRARDVNVLVLNGTGVSGAAHAAGGDVAALGFTVTGYGNYTQRVSQTVVGYPTGQEAAARLLANALGLSRIVPAQTDGGIVLLIGGDWQGTQPQVVQAPPQGGGNGGGNGGGGNGGGTSGGS